MKKAVLVLFIVKKQQVLFRVSLTTVENLEPKIRSIYPSIQQLNVWDNVSFLIIREDVGLGNIFICFFPHSSPPPPTPTQCVKHYLIGMLQNYIMIHFLPLGDFW